MTTVSPREVRVASITSAATSVIFLLDAWWHHALGIPRNDDWSYFRSTFSLAQTGAFHLSGWDESTLILQSFLSWPLVKIFGPHFLPLQVLVAFIGAGGLVLAYCLFRSFVAPRGAAFSVAMVAIGPIFGSLETSYMTDVPAFTAAMGCLVAGTKSVSGPRRNYWFALAMALGVAAFGIRQVGAIAPAGVAVAVLALRQGRERLVVASGGFLALGAIWAINHWQSHLANSKHLRVSLTSSFVAGRVGWDVDLLFTLALFVGPAIVAWSPTLPWITAWRRAPRAFATFLAIVSMVLLWYRPEPSGNYFSTVGAYSNTLIGAPPTVFARPLWEIIRLFGLACVFQLCAIVFNGALALPEVWRRATSGKHRDEAALVSLVYVAMFVAAEMVYVIVVPQFFFDRYLLPVVGTTAALAWCVLETVLRTPSRPRVVRSNRVILMRRALPAALLVGWSVVGFIEVDAAATLDGAEWHFDNQLVSAGMPATALEGGFDWYASHQNVPAHLGRHSVPFWLDVFAPTTVCEEVAFPRALPPKSIPVAVYNAHTIDGTDYRLVAFRILYGPHAATVCPTYPVTTTK